MNVMKVTVLQMKWMSWRLLWLLFYRWNEGITPAATEIRHLETQQIGSFYVYFLASTNGFFCQGKEWLKSVIKRRKMFCVDLLYSFLFFFYRMQHSIKVFTRFIYLHFFIIFYVYSICRFVLVLRLCIGDKKVVVSTSIHKALLITFINIYNVNIMHQS